MITRNVPFYSRRLLSGLLTGIFCLLISQACFAESHDLQQKVDDIHAQISQEEEVRDQLRNDLDSLDAKVEDLKERLKVLEEKISKQQQ